MMLLTIRQAAANDGDVVTFLKFELGLTGGFKDAQKSEQTEGTDFHGG
jgi:hypothetical protein